MALRALKPMRTSPLYPIALRLEGVPCLVVGGGRIAARKANQLLECGAAVTVVAPKTSPELDALRDRLGQLERRAYLPGDLDKVRLAITATGDAVVDHQVFADGEAAGVLVNSADDPEACRFFLPAVHREGPVTVAVSTAGASPYLATFLRRRIAGVVGPEVATVAALLSVARAAIRSAGRSSESVDWGAVADDDLLDLVAGGATAAAARRISEWTATQLASRPGR